MSAPVTTASIWRNLSDHAFAVLSWVTPSGAARSAGIVYVVRDNKLLIGAEKTSWKAKHIIANPNVSVTVTIPRKILFLPWIHIPDATITIHGKAKVKDSDEVDPGVKRDLTRGMVEDPVRDQNTCIIEVNPEGEFLTYGIDVSLQAMRDPQKAMGRAPVN